MAATHKRVGINPTAKYIGKSYDASAANAQLVLTTPTGDSVRRLSAVYAKYSGAVTQNVAIRYKPGHGAAYETLHAEIVLSTNDEGVFVPDEDVWLLPDDAYEVTAPAGGVGITSALTITYEEY